MLVDQLREVYIDSDLEPVDTTNYFPRVLRRDYGVGLGASAGGNDPDQGFYTTYACDAERNYTGYCNPEADGLIERQSREADKEKRKRLVWDIERKLAEDGAQPAIYYDRRATCWQPYVKRADDHRQQPLQRLAYGRRLAQQITGVGFTSVRGIGAFDPLEAYQTPATERAVLPSDGQASDNP